MLVHTCDKCGKTILEFGESGIVAGIGYKTHEFCTECGARLADMLELTLDS